MKKFVIVMFLAIIFLFAGFSQACNSLEKPEEWGTVCRPMEGIPSEVTAMAEPYASRVIINEMFEVSDISSGTSGFHNKNTPELLDSEDKQACFGCLCSACMQISRVVFDNCGVFLECSNFMNGFNVAEKNRGYNLVYKCPMVNFLSSFLLYSSRYNGNILCLELQHVPRGFVRGYNRVYKYPIYNGENVFEDKLALNFIS